MVDSINNLMTTNSNEINLKKQQNINFHAVSTNSLERSPNKDTVEKKGMSTGGKFALGAATLIGAAALIDVVVCKGRHIKNILGQTKKEGTEYTDDILKNLQKNKAATEVQEKATIEAQEKATKEAQEKAVKEAQEKAAKEAQEKAAKEAQEKAAKEAQEKAAKEAQEKAAKEAQEKAAKEAQEKAAKEAQEKAAKEAQEKAAKEAQEKAAKEAQEKAAKEAQEKIEKEFLDTKLNPILNKLSKSEQEVNECYYKIYDGKDISVQEIKRILDHHLKCHNEYLALEKEAGENVYHLCNYTDNSFSDWLGNYIEEFYNTQTAVQTFEQQFSRVLRNEIEPFHDDFIAAYKKLKLVSDDFGKSVKEIKSLKSSAQKFVEQIESKGIHIDELKEHKVFSEEFFKSIDSVPQDQIRFFEDYYSRMNIAFQEIVDRYSFNELGRTNIM